MTSSMALPHSNHQLGLADVTVKGSRDAPGQAKGAALLAANRLGPSGFRTSSGSNDVFVTNGPYFCWTS